MVEELKRKRERQSERANGELYNFESSREDAKIPLIPEHIVVLVVAAKKPERV